MSDDLFKHYQKQLTEAASHQRYALSKALARLGKGADSFESAQAYRQARLIFESRLQASLDWVQNRIRSVPAVEFPPDLPIADKRAVIAEAITANPVVIVAGETGSGKTTQLPKICLELGRGVRGIIAHTQPRRLAARTVASRIAEELKTPLGGLVGYQIRFTDRSSEHSLIKLMTDGILLAEMQRDRYFSRYDTLIIDEAHERSLNIDFLLGYTKQLLSKRPDLKVIVTSATIDVEKFSNHFDNAPVVSISGRTYPVEVFYRPPVDHGNISMAEAITNGVQEIRSIDHRGDILVFLPGERDIRETAVQLRRAQIPHLDIVPLYSRLSIAEQNKIFQSHSAQRVVLATNVAETSLTVPGIRYVIDPGYARISRYSYRTKVQRLPVEAISQASANQRKGRCGRIAEGICFRLYSEEDFLTRPEFTDPEILRTNLSAVILQMVALKLGDIRQFAFIDRPDDRMINDGYKRLQELQAIHADKRITAIGRQLVRLPLDPGLARILLAAEANNCLKEVMTIVSALAVQDPRERPTDKQQAADQAHRQFWHEHSDFLFWLNLWSEYDQQRQQLSNNQLQKWCRRHYLAPSRMREWRDIHSHITMAVRQLAFHLNDTKADYAAIHRALLSGFLGNIAFNSGDKDLPYQGARNRRFNLFPGSSQYKKKPRWILAGELIETNRLYAHSVAQIEPQWIIAMAAHLLDRRYSQPHYNARSGQVMVYERVSLYGLILSDNQRVNYAPINPTESREIFIRAALVEGHYADHRRIQQQLQNASADQHFFLNQQKLIEEICALEAKSRRHDILVDDEILFEFYNQRLAPDIVNLDGFEHWRKQAEDKQAGLLVLHKNQLMRHQAAGITGDLFPDHFEIHDLRLPLVYQFDPAHRDDGVTLKVPIGALHLLSENRLQWLVPGFLTEKITALIKALPKRWRKQFAPVPATVDAILPNLKPCDRPLVEVLSECLFRYKGVQIPESVWREIQPDDYYRMNIHILDEQGRFIEGGRKLSTLRQRYRERVQDQLQQSDHPFEKQGLKTWCFGTLPEACELQQKLQQQQLQVRAYPGLQDRGDYVDLRLFDDREEAAANTLRGTVRLGVISQPQTVKYLRKHLLRNKELSLSFVSIGDRVRVADDIIMAAVRQTSFGAVDSAHALIRSEEAFHQHINASHNQWLSRAQELQAILLQSLDIVAEIKKTIRKTKNPLALAHAASDIQQQLNGLFYDGLMYDTPYEWLIEYPRYLKAILLRLEKVPRQINKDKGIIDEIQALWSNYESSAKANCAIFNTELIRYRWMIEELRVSQFAQSLGTRLPVSVKRVQRQWQLC